MKSSFLCFPSLENEIAFSHSFIFFLTKHHWLISPTWNLWFRTCNLFNSIAKLSFFMWHKVSYFHVTSTLALPLSFTLFLLSASSFRRWSSIYPHADAVPPALPDRAQSGPTPSPDSRLFNPSGQPGRESRLHGTNQLNHYIPPVSHSYQKISGSWSGESHRSRDTLVPTDGWLSHRSNIPYGHLLYLVWVPSSSWPSYCLKLT